MSVEILQPLWSGSLCVSEWKERYAFPMQSHLALQSGNVHVEVLGGRMASRMMKCVGPCESCSDRQALVDREQVPQQRVPATGFVPRRMFLGAGVVSGDSPG